MTVLSFCNVSANQPEINLNLICELCEMNMLNLDLKNLDKTIRNSYVWLKIENMIAAPDSSIIHPSSSSKPRHLKCVLARIRRKLHMRKEYGHNPLNTRHKCNGLHSNEKEMKECRLTKWAMDGITDDITWLSKTLLTMLRIVAKRKLCSEDDLKYTEFYNTVKYVTIGIPDLYKRLKTSINQIVDQNSKAFGKNARAILNLSFCFIEKDLNKYTLSVYNYTYTDLDALFRGPDIYFFYLLSNITTLLKIYLPEELLRAIRCETFFPDDVLRANFEQYKILFVNQLLKHFKTETEYYYQGYKSIIMRLTNYTEEKENLRSALTDIANRIEIISDYVNSSSRTILSLVLNPTIFKKELRYLQKKVHKLLSFDDLTLSYKIVRYIGNFSINPEVLKSIKHSSEILPDVMLETDPAMIKKKLFLILNMAHSEKIELIFLLYFEELCDHLKKRINRSDANSSYNENDINILRLTNILILNISSIRNPNNILKCLNILRTKGLLGKYFIMQAINHGLPISVCIEELWRVHELYNFSEETSLETFFLTKDKLKNIKNSNTKLANSNNSISGSFTNETVRAIHPGIILLVNRIYNEVLPNRDISH